MICSKLHQILVSLFTRDSKLLPVVSLTKLYVVYYQVNNKLRQIYQLIHIALQFSILSSTNNPIYILSTTIISLVELLLYIILRFSTSHLIFKGLIVMGLLCFISSLYIFSIIIVKYAVISGIGQFFTVSVHV